MGKLDAYINLRNIPTDVAEYQANFNIHRLLFCVNDSIPLCNCQFLLVRRSCPLCDGFGNVNPFACVSAVVIIISDRLLPYITR